MRIIAGTLKGRKLIPPADMTIRPTADRTRESIFNLLMHGQYAGEAIIDQHVVDACCGTGALGLEAISRGATKATFIDSSKKAIELARDNAIHCQVSSKCHFLHSDVRNIGTTNDPAALVLIDAPYDMPILASAYARLRTQRWVREGSLLVAELPYTQKPPVLDGAEFLDTRKYGKATVHIWRVG
jgi:16S rRNA (guanine966-N2)-methyltransferase